MRTSSCEAYSMSALRRGELAVNRRTGGPPTVVATSYAGGYMVDRSTDRAPPWVPITLSQSDQARDALDWLPRKPHRQSWTVPCVSGGQEGRHWPFRKQ